MRRFSKVLIVSWCVFFASLLGAQAADSRRDAASANPTRGVAESADERYGNLPLSFEANQGQTDSQARFVSRGDGYSFFLTPSGAVLTFSGNAHSPVTSLNMQFAGASASARIQGLDALPGRNNYFFGSDSQRWRIGVPTYAKVAYENVYPGISLVYYGNQRQLEYDFVVAPGADPGKIRLRISGADRLTVDSQGNLVLHSSSGEVQLLAPQVYQQTGGHKQEISGQWTLVKKNVAGFRVGSYDRSRALVIDPVLMYSSFLGGSQKNALNRIVIDAAGNAYVAGYTASGDFPAAPTPQANTFGNGTPGRGAFVAKIDPSGSNLLYTTYLSGSVDEEATGLAVDKAGNVYLSGTTHSPDFPTHNAFQSTCNTHVKAGTCSSAYLTKISPGGDSLVFSTYLGGSGGESGRGLAVDAAGSAYVAGVTSSVDFPVTTGAAQQKCGGACQQNAFIAKFNPAGDSLAYATYLGGSGVDDSADLAVDASGNAYITGHTTSPDFPLTTPFQKSCALDITSTTGACVATAFVTKIKSDGSAFAYSTYLGGSTGTQASGIAVDALGSAYVTGSTQSADFPVVRAFQKSCGVDSTSHACSVDAFVTKFAPSGQSLVYSTYLGGSGRDEASGIVLDSAGNAHIIGSTESADFPTAASVQSQLKGTSDAFVARFNAAGNSLGFATYHGGSATESGSGIALDATGNVYVAGLTSSADFPTAHPFQSSCAGTCASAFVTKMSLPPPATLPPTISKVFGAATVPLNGTTSLTFTITNPNPATTLTGIGFTDTLPAGLAVSTPNGLSGTCGGGTITATAGSTSISLSAASLAGAASCSFSVNNDGVAAGTQTNTTSAVTSVEGGNGNTASASIDVVAPPSIAKAFGAATIPLNGTTSLTFTITNSNGADALTGVAFTDTLPSGLAVASPPSLTNTCGGTATGTAGAASVSLSAGSIAASASCTVSVNVTGNTAGLKNNSVQVTSTNGGTGNTSSTTVTVVQAPTITKSFGASNIPLNGTTSLSFSINNPNTTGTLTGVAFTDSLPAGLVVATPNALTNTCGGTATAIAGSGTVSLTGGTLAASASCTVSVNVIGTTAGVKNNSVQVTSTEGGTGNTSNATLTVASPPTIAKAFGAATIVLNNSTSLTLTITNPNTTVALTGLAVTDSLPAGLVVATPNALTNTCGGTATAVAGSGSVSLSAGTLASSASCAISLNVTGSTSGTKNNTTGPVSATEGGTGTTSNTATVTVQDFNWTISSNAATVIQGQSTSSTTSPVATATPVSGFNQNVAVSCTVSPATATVTCTPSPAAIAGGNGTSTVTINTTAATPIGIYTVTIIGTDNTPTVPLSHNQAFTLTVECTWTVSPASQTVNADATTGGKYSVNLALTGGSQCPWSATSSSFVHLTAASGTTGAGGSVVSFDVDNFYGASATAPRSGNINFDFTNGTNGSGFTQPTGTSSVSQNEVVMSGITSTPVPPLTVHVNTGATAAGQISVVASATNTVNPNALWSLTGNCNGPCGTITSTATTNATYKAPANIAGSASPHTSASDMISAASQADPTKVSPTVPTVQIINDQPLCTGPAAVMADPIHSAINPSTGQVDPINNPVAIRIQHICSDNADNENDLMSATVAWGDAATASTTFSATGVATGTINPNGTDATFSHAYAATNFGSPYSITADPTDTSNATALAGNIAPANVTITYVASSISALAVEATHSNSQDLPSTSLSVTFAADPCAPTNNANNFAVSGIVKSDGTTDPANFGITCSVAVNVSNTAYTLTVNTTAASAPALKRQSKFAASLVMLSLGVPGVVFLGLGVSVFGSKSGKRNRRLLCMFGILLMLSALILLPACGGGIHAPFIGNSGNTNAVYFLTLTGVDATGTQQTFIVPLTVTPPQ